MIRSRREARHIPNAGSIRDSLAQYFRQTFENFRARIAQSLIGGPQQRFDSVLPVLVQAAYRRDHPRISGILQLLLKFPGGITAHLIQVRGPLLLVSITLPADKPQTMTQTQRSTPRVLH